MEVSSPPSRKRRAAAAIGRAIRRGVKALASRVETMFSSRGPEFRSLAQAHAASVAGDALVTLALAGTLFFQVPSSEARDKVALYLLLTLAPFAVLAPLLGGIFARFPTAYRAGLVFGAGLRVVVVVAMLFAGLSTLWLFPLAFFLLVFSRLHGISRGSLLPVVLKQPLELVGGNAHLARIGVLSSAAAVVIGGPVVFVDLTWLALILAGAAYIAAAFNGSRVPSVRVAPPAETAPRPLLRKQSLPRGVRLARLATAGVRLLNGFLLLLVAFAFRDVDASVIDFGALLSAAGAGFFIASFVSPWLARRLREEPMVVAALAVEAAAAFITAQAFGLPAAAALAAAAGLAWGTGKFGFDGLLQATVDPRYRGAAFTSSETMFQLVWVVGALIPVVVKVPIKFGLASAGIAALLIQVVYMSGLLMPLAEERRRLAESSAAEAERRDVTEFLG